MLLSVPVSEIAAAAAAYDDNRLPATKIISIQRRLGPGALGLAAAAVAGDTGRSHQLTASLPPSNSEPIFSHFIDVVVVLFACIRGGAPGSSTWLNVVVVVIQWKV